jgi:hypothetical protein
VKKGLALAILVLAAAALTGCGLLEDDVPTAEVGDCVTNDLVGGGTIEEFEVVSCTDSHRAEMFFKFDMPDGDFPGQEGINTAVVEECQGSAFEDYVGTPYDESAVFVSPVTPTEETWNEADDREVLCFAVAQDGSESTESVKGSGT